MIIPIVGNVEVSYKLRGLRLMGNLLACTETLRVRLSQLPPNFLEKEASMTPAVNTLKELLLTQLIELPVFHEAALKVLQLTKKDEYNVDEVTKIINEDPALAITLLQASNSVFFRGIAEATTVKEAILRLGSNQVVNMLFTISMESNTAGDALIKTRMHEFWNHSHAVARTAHAMVKSLPSLKVNPDEVYLGGLLHDVGSLYLLKSLDKYVDSGLIKLDNDLINYLLREVHVPMGVRLMTHWHIPQLYQEIVFYHHDSHWEASAVSELIAVVRICNRLYYDFELATSSPDIQCEADLIGLRDVHSTIEMIKTLRTMTSW